ncbi:hypothetical protein [Candidatus Nitrospira salsa]
MGRVLMIKRYSGRLTVLFFAVVMTTLVACTSTPQTEQREALQQNASPQEQLGTVNFPTSARSREAQWHFLRGVAALHSFWYPVALDEFRAATRLEPDFMMGYWGEAMTHNHPVWNDPQETEAARNVIAKIENLPHITPRERAWLHAIEILYGKGDKPTRDRAYADVMENISRDYPSDSEAALFYALALLGTVKTGHSDAENTRLHAADIASRVYQDHPNHPGAAHYIIHAYDDPHHAHLALDAAERYAKIAPDAPHALHMPSHIFLQLGMWPQAAASNEAAWTASNQWVQQRNLSLSKRDYHTLHWLMYVYLQQGRYQQAEELVMVMHQSLAHFSKDNPRDFSFGLLTHARMISDFALQTKNWGAVESYLQEGQTEIEVARMDMPASFNAYAAAAQIPILYTRGMAAAMTDSVGANESLAKLDHIREQLADSPEPFIVQEAKYIQIRILEIEAVLDIQAYEFNKAITLMQKATRLSETMPPPSGPPSVSKPTFELFGEISLHADQPKNAAEQFSISLKRHPNRASTLLGLARAAVKNRKSDEATHFYTELLRQWSHADALLADLQEAKQYEINTLH